MANNNTEFASMRKDIKETLKTVLLMNNSLQSFKQDTTLHFEDLEKNMKDGFAELKDLIFKGDQALVRLLIERERDIEKLTESVQALTARVYALEHHVAG